MPVQKQHIGFARMPQSDLALGTVRRRKAHDFVEIGHRYGRIGFLHVSAVRPVETGRRVFDRGQFPFQLGHVAAAVQRRQCTDRPVESITQRQPGAVGAVFQPEFIRKFLKPLVHFSNQR